MANEIAATRSYRTMLDKIIGAVLKQQGANLRLYHKIGTLFNSFLDESGGSKYGEATAQQLADDITKSGVLPEIKDTLRFLYWSKAIADEHPQIESIDKLADIGFTVTHAKLLYSVDPEIRDEIKAGMVDSDGKVISTRALNDIIQEVGQRRIGERSAIAAAENRTWREEGDTGTEEASESAPEAEEADTAAESEDTDAPASEGDAPRPDSAPATGRPTNPERAVANPLKVIRSLYKSVIKANGGVPDAFIVLRETAQNGFDSDAAFNRYNETVRSLRASLAAFVEPAQELIAAIDSELQAADLAASDA